MSTIIGNVLVLPNTNFSVVGGVLVEYMGGYAASFKLVRTERMVAVFM